MKSKLDLYLKTWFSGLREPSGAPIIGFRWWPGIGTLTWRAYIYASQMTCVTRHTTINKHTSATILFGACEACTDHRHHGAARTWGSADVMRPLQVLSYLKFSTGCIISFPNYSLNPSHSYVLQQSQLSSRNDHTLKAERVHLPSSTVYTQDSYGTTCQSESFSQHGEWC